jgi:nucleotide-binding universal stress UspA family protein
VKKRIYVPLLTYPDAATETLLDNAVELAGNLNATLCATIFDVSIPPITNPWPVFLDTEDMVRRAEHKSRQEGEAFSRVLQKRCVEAKVPLEIKSITVSQPDVIDNATGEARLFDMTLAQSATQFASLAESLIFGAGRPVILYPDRACSGRIDHVAIAWDGSRAAARALADASCFIDRADRITVIGVREKPIDRDVGALLDALTARGANVVAEIFQASHATIGRAIQNKALELRADLLVMGGFGHSRLREFVLGGTTANVLSNTMMPVLMSH